MASTVPVFLPVDGRRLRADDGAVVDVLDAVAALPWVDQLCPLMPHQYAVLRRSPEWAWFALDAMVRSSPESYLAYFRGYQSPNRYWEGPDGLRYWRTRFELNRCTLDSVEPPRRVDDGAKPIREWVGPPHAPNRAGLYARDAEGKWWPRFEGTDMKPCRGCQRRLVARPLDDGSSRNSFTRAGPALAIRRLRGLDAGVGD